MTIATDIQKLYVAYFNRPADFGGLLYWENQVNKNGGDVSAVANAFSASKEYTDLYAGKSAAAIIDTIYQNLFGRVAEPAGLAFWSQAMINGVDVGHIALAIMNGAQNADLVAVTNKATAAEAFYAALDTNAEIVGYSGVEANAVASAWLKTITTDASLAAATTPAALLAVTTDASTVGSNTAGTSFTLTDVIDTLTGTASNDTFIGDAATATSADSVNGGDGTDTVRIFDLAAASDIPTLSSVEVVELVNAAAPAGTLDLTAVTAMTSLVLDNATDGDEYLINSTVAATVKNMINAESVILTSRATDATADLTVSGLDAANAGTVTVNFDGAAIATVNIAATGSASNLTFATTGVETTVNVTGDQALTLVEAATSITTFNASAATGAVTFDMSGATGANQTITGGSGNDSLTVDLAVNLTLDAGAGNDVVTLNNALAANLTSTTGAADSIKGGEGTDVLAVTAAGAVALAADTVADLAVISGFEKLRTTSDLNASALDISVFGLNSLQIGAATTGAAATVSGFTSGATIEYRAAADSAVAVDVGMTGATGAGTPDDLLNISLNANLVDQAVAADAFAVEFGVSGINKLVVTTADRVNTDAATARDDGYILTLSDDNNVSLLTVKGSSELAFTSSATTAALATVDASALTGDLILDLTTNGLTQGVTVTGGAGVNDVTGTGFGDIITGGARADIINAGAGADVLTGAAGADTFVFAASESGGVPSATVFDTITDFAKASDLIEFAGIVLSADAASTASVGVAAINAEGFATFNAADDTLAEMIAAVNAGLTAGTEADGQIAIFQNGGNSYVYIYDTSATTVGAEDVLIKLTGVTGLTDTTITVNDLMIA